MSEKNQKPTSQKLRKAREEGQVAHSKDLTQNILMLALATYLLIDASSISKRITEMMIAPASLMKMEFEAALNLLALQMIQDFLVIVAPFILIVILLGLLVEMSQTGMLFAFKALKPSGKKLNVIQNIKNMFGKKGIVEFVKSNLKVIILFSVVYVNLRNELPALMTLPQVDVAGIGHALGELLRAMFIQIAVAYTIISAADFAWQRHHFMQQQMMSIDEVRRDYKEQEGDPHLKGERKHLHQQMLQEQAVHSAQAASVLITNPTHLAIALLYRHPETPLPRILAKGEGALAARMMVAARAAGVPVLQNIPLARELMRLGVVDQYIPDDLVVPVAEVLRMVQEIRQDGGA